MCVYFKQDSLSTYLKKLIVNGILCGSKNSLMDCLQQSTNVYPHVHRAPLKPI